MAIDMRSASKTIAGARTNPVAVTTILKGRGNGLIALGGGGASMVPEAPRPTISLSKYNLTHDMVLESGVFAYHLLPAAPEDALNKALAVFTALAGRSGRSGDKMATLATKPGVSGAPILLDALSYVEARVVKSFDLDENTLFLGEIIAAETFGEGAPLSAPRAWQVLPKEWTKQYEWDLHDQINAARQRRGLPLKERANTGA